MVWRHLRLRPGHRGGADPRRTPPHGDSVSVSAPARPRGVVAAAALGACTVTGILLWGCTSPARASLALGAAAVTALLWVPVVVAAAGGGSIRSSPRSSSRSSTAWGFR